QIVDADAEELRGRIGNRRPVPDLGERKIGRKALHPAQQIQRASGEHVAEAGELAAQPGPGVDHAVADDDAEAVAAFCGEAEQPHNQALGTAASCARLRTASSSPSTRCPDSPSRRTDTLSSVTSLRPTARITGTFASECSRTL